MRFSASDGWDVKHEDEGVGEEGVEQAMGRARLMGREVPNTGAGPERVGQGEKIWNSMLV